MSLQALAAAHVAEESHVLPAVTTLRPIRNPVLQLVVALAPWVILVILIFAGGFLNDPMFSSALLTAAVGLFIFQLLMQRIPQTFDVLWQRNVFASKTTAGKGSAPADHGAADAELVRQYESFLGETERWLNRRWSWVLGFIFAALAFARRPYQAGGLAQFWQFLVENRSDIAWLVWFDFLAEPLLGFIVGLLFWRMIVIAFRVRELGRRFDVNVQLGHPDECGGLEPLGNLCLWNALLVSLMGIWLGAWIVLELRFGWYSDYYDLHSRLLWVPFVLAPITFLMPLLSTHQIMAAKATQVGQQLDQLAQSIDRLSRDLLSRSESIDPAEGDRLTKQIAFMQQIYERNRSLPTWPIHVSSMRRFALAQVVPVFGLFVSQKAVLDLLQSLVNSVK